MTEYTVRQLAGLAGVSVRTLHHYDHIGLLSPSSRSAAGYRQYSGDDALRLQQILFFRELGFALGDIQRILDDPGFDRAQALQSHRLLLQERSRRLAQLITTIDRTLAHLKENEMPLTDTEIYEGFSEDEISRIQEETRRRYDPRLVEESERRIRRMSKPEWDALKAEGVNITRDLAGLADRSPGDPRVQALIVRHYAMIGKYYSVTKEIYRGLGQLYVDHDGFRSYYERFRPGLAHFMRDAMAYYCDHAK
jgi:MerR family transcriptional regulator, thiopeptide resistance regulator